MPCKGHVDGKPCPGRFKIDALRQFLSQGIAELPCQFCYGSQHVIELMYGFVEEDSREQLARIEAKLDQGVAYLRTEFTGFESRVAAYVMAIMQALASEARQGPRLFTVEPVGGWHRVKPRRLVSAHFRLHLWCEAENAQHPVEEEGKGAYEFEESREWMKAIAPYANVIGHMLRTLSPLAAIGAAVGLPARAAAGPAGVGLALMVQATSTLLEGDLEAEDHSALREHAGVLREPERSGILALHALLRRLDPNHEKLGLYRVPTYTGDYLWLCRKHYDEWQPKIPDRIE